MPNEMFDRARMLHAHAATLREVMLGGLLQRISEAEGGLRAGRFEPMGSPGSHSDTTASWALRGTDMAGQHRVELAQSMGRAQRALMEALSIASLYPPPRIADDEDRAALARINGREPCCENCAQLRLRDGMARWEPIDSRLAEATTVGGRLVEPALLCVWCVERTRAWGRLPNAEELARHHDGRRVPWPADVERPERGATR